MGPHAAQQSCCCASWTITLFLAFSSSAHGFLVSPTLPQNALTCFSCQLGSGFIKCSSHPVVVESPGTFQLVEMFVSVPHLESFLSFYALAADEMPVLRLVQGWVTFRVQSFTCFVDKCSLSLQTWFVREEQRLQSRWFLKESTLDPTIKPLPNTHAKASFQQSSRMS